MNAIRDYVTIPGAAEILGVSEVRVRQFVRERRLRSERFGPLRVIRKDLLRAFARQPRKTGRPKKVS
jgi:excisionase family DNA binding protein